MSKQKRKSEILHINASDEWRARDERSEEVQRDLLTTSLSKDIQFWHIQQAFTLSWFNFLCAPHSENPFDMRLSPSLSCKITRTSFRNEEFSSFFIHVSREVHAASNTRKKICGESSNVKSTLIMQTTTATSPATKGAS